MSSNLFSVRQALKAANKVVSTVAYIQAASLASCNNNCSYSGKNMYTYIVQLTTTVYMHYSTNRVTKLRQWGECTEQLQQRSRTQTNMFQVETLAGMLRSTHGRLIAQHLVVATCQL